MKQLNSNIIASFGTVLVMALAILLLFLLSMSFDTPKEDEGLMVSFGYSDIGGGQEDGQMQPESEPLTTVVPPSSAPSQQDLMTQDNEQSLALQRQQEEKRRQQQALAEQRRKEREEKQRIEAERRAEEARIAAENAKKQQAIDNANKFGNLFGQTNNPEGSGGSGNSASSDAKGNPLGSGVSGGNSWSLNGRSLIGALPKPQGSFEREGTVVVAITVDANGNVVSATVTSGTDISDYATQQMAINAAKQAKFNIVDRPDKTLGKITYHFKFK